MIHYYSMSKTAQGYALVLVGVIIFIGLAFSFPQRAVALGGAANAICFEPGMCQYGTRCGKDGPPGVLNKPCFDTVNGIRIDGVCIAPQKCEGRSGGGAGGIGEQAITSLLGQAMQQIMGALQGGGGGGGSGSGYTPDSSLAGCTDYYQVSTPSTDPCAIYSPSALLDAGSTGSSGIADSLLGALGSPNPSNVSSGILDTIKNVTGTGSSTQENAQAPTPGNQGLSGDLRVANAGATIFANLREGLSEVAGFFGGSTGGVSQALSAAGRLCATRPWEGGIAGASIAPAFFDGICKLSGYQVGAITPTQSGQVRNVPGASSGSNSGNQQPIQFGVASDVPPEADIWAEPASVRLGTRTYIFWRAQGVVSCAATGPNFSQNSFSGGASTVPISGPTTFSIECLTGASTTISDSVTVQIAI